MRIHLRNRDSAKELTDLAFQAVQDTQQEYAETQKGAVDPTGWVPGADSGEDPDWLPGGEKHGRALERFRLALQKASPKGKAIDDALVLEGPLELADGPIATLLVALIDLAVDALLARHRRRRREAARALAETSIPK